jgi:hypothetical protein
MLGKADSSQTCTELKLDSVIFGGLALLLGLLSLLLGMYPSVVVAWLYCHQFAHRSPFSHYGGVNTGEFHAVETRLASIDKATFYSTKAIIIPEVCQGLGDMGTPGEML